MRVCVFVVLVWQPCTRGGSKQRGMSGSSVCRETYKRRGVRVVVVCVGRVVVEYVESSESSRSVMRVVGVVGVC